MSKCKEQFRMPKERISKYFSPGTPAKQMEDTIVKALELTKGSRVGQLVITPVVIADFVSELGEQRGTGGFGSTGE